MLFHSPRLASFALFACLVSASCVPDPGRAERANADFLGIVGAEDARPSGGDQLRVLVDGTRHDLAFIRHAAVRALGRLERPDLVDHITPLLDDPSPMVRGSAVNAVAQAYHTSDDASAAADILLARIETESDAGVRGTLARSLGRLALDARGRRIVADALVGMSRTGATNAPQVTLVGVAMGLESLVRASPDEGITARVAQRLRELATYPTRRIGDPDPERIRALALNALGLARRMDVQLILIALQDPSPQVGVTAARYVDVAAPGMRAEMLRRVASHGVLQTAIEGVRQLQTEPLDLTRCQLLLSGIQALDPGTPAVPLPVAIMAIRALDRPCPDVDTQRDQLIWVAESIDEPAVPWQAASAGLVSLARLAPAETRLVLPKHVAHQNGFVRAYAARVATMLGDRATLTSLLDDDDPNVRTAAVEGRVALDGRAADPVLVAQLAQDDPQLLLTVAGHLEGTADPDSAARAALDAFVRISEARRETWRDPRRALLGLLAEIGDPSMAATLTPYLDDYDSTVAGDVAEILEAWTGRARVPDPRPLPRAPLPSVDELRALDGAHVLLHMEGGGVIDIELHPYLATTNVHRFVRLVEEGYFDGLTFHRWAPNFVIQGGSPNANEYQGDAAYTRDEVGSLPHWRGTVGISTRGHDTGDGQIFVNLLDNVRLDHTYTIIGTVVEGMEVVDMVVEGTVIERARVVPADRVAGM